MTSLANFRFLEPCSDLRCCFRGWRCFAAAVQCLSLEGLLLRLGFCLFNQHIRSAAFVTDTLCELVLDQLIDGRIHRRSRATFSYEDLLQFCRVESSMIAAGVGEDDVLRSLVVPVILAVGFLCRPLDRLHVSA